MAVSTANTTSEISNCHRQALAINTEICHLISQLEKEGTQDLQLKPGTIDLSKAAQIAIDLIELKFPELDSSRY